MCVLLCMNSVVFDCVYVRVFNLWLSESVNCILVGVCMSVFCSVWVCICSGFLMCGCVYVWDL